MAELGPMVMDAIRSMIGRIELTPDEAGGLDAVPEGDLARILAICAKQDSKNTRPERDGGSRAVLASRVSVVAGAGFEPATFRL